jgi:IS30 family transposase
MKKHTLKAPKKYSHVSLDEREEIAIGLENGKRQREIALLLGRNPSTISREIKRNNPAIRNVRYRANRAQLKAEEGKVKSHKKERIPNKKIRRFICKQLKMGYSPEIIAFNVSEKNKTWKTNYETIYQWIYHDRQDLIPFLTKSHKKRRNRGCAQQKHSPKIPNRTMIEKRPEYVNRRCCIGHWEIDTAVSRQSKAAIMVLTERRTRYVIIKKLSAKPLLLCITLP